MPPHRQTSLQVRDSVARVERAWALQEYEKKFQEEMGTTAATKRVDRYMRATTRAGTAMLDPTSRLPEHPSAATVTKQRNFGLGTARADVREKVAAKHAAEDLPLVAPLVPRTIQQALGTGESAADVEGGRRSSPVKAAESLAVPEFEGMWHERAASAPAGTPAGALPGLQLSKFERRVLSLPLLQGTALACIWAPCVAASEVPGFVLSLSKHQVCGRTVQAMEKAALRHRQGLVQPQTFAGKELKGAPFSATPAHPTFKDFCPGETYKQKVTMTNVSFGRCTFKMMPVPDEFADVLTVDYVPPGHLSAGMTCDLWVTFTPRLNEDISTVIPLLADTGPVLVPLTCSSKKAAVSASEQVLDFGAAVTLGDSRTRQLTLRNAGALDVRLPLTACSALAFSKLWQGGVGVLLPLAIRSTYRCQWHARSCATGQVCNRGGRLATAHGAAAS